MTRSMGFNAPQEQEMRPGPAKDTKWELRYLVVQLHHSKPGTRDTTQWPREMEEACLSSSQEINIKIGPGPVTPDTAGHMGEENAKGSGPL